MSVTELQRHQIFQWFEEQMGPERAAAMMSLLPPVGWGDIVTGTELRGEIARLSGELARTEGRLQGDIAKVRDDLSKLRFQISATAIASNVALAGVILAATQLG